MASALWTLWSGVRASCWPPTAVPVLVPTPEGTAFSSNKASPPVAKMPSFVYHGEFTCISERWTIRSRCFNVNTSVKGVTPSHPTPAQEWQWGQEPLAWGWQPERPPPHLCCWAGAQWAGPPVPGPHHAHFRENMRPLLAFVFVLMDVGRKFFIPEQKQQTHSCCT